MDQKLIVAMKLTPEEAARLARRAELGMRPPNMQAAFELKRLLSEPEPATA
jgi:hypothetical protein